MKRLQRRKEKKDNAAPKEPPPPPAAPRSRWRWPVLILCLLLAAGGTWAVFEYVIWTNIPGALIGKWVVEGGEQDGANFDFFRDGTMVGRINLRGSEGIIKARVRVEGDKLLLITQNSQTGQAVLRTQRIRTLTRTELVLEDGKGQVTRMVRAD